jgi:hypothetical protein
MRFFYIFGILIFSILGCGQKKGMINFNDPETPFFISMERTYCYGECPEYIFSISHKGAFLYEGFRNVYVLGEGKADVDKEDVMALRKRMSELPWATYPDAFECNVADLPSVLFVVKSKGFKKKLKVVCDQPAEIDAFIIWLDALNKKYMPDEVQAPDSPEGPQE